MSRDDHYLKRELYALIQGSPEVFEFLQGGSLDGIWYWDLESPEHEWMSPHFWELFGYEPEQKRHLASEWQDMIHPEDLELALENFRRHAADPGYPYDQLVRYRHRDGSTVWVRCRGLIIRDAQGNPQRMLGAHTDVSSLQRANAELRRSNADLERFARVVSHDLRAPLGTVGSYVELLQRRAGDRLDERELRYLHHIAEGVNRMRSMVEDLLVFSRVSGQTARRERASLAGPLAEAMASLQADIDIQNARIAIGELPELEIDPGLVRQLFQNLLSNAMKFNAPPIEIRIDARRVEEAWEIAVRDNGIGFDPGSREKIFMFFERLHARSEYPGNGLGLGICQRIAEQHGGAIRAESAPGEGASFIVTFPV